MQVILRQLGDCNIRRAEPSDLIPVMEINLKTLPEHYSDYFYESLLAEVPEAFIVAEIGGKHVGYIMCKTEYGFSNFKKLGFVKKGHVVSIAVLDDYRKKGIGNVLVEESVKGIKLKHCDVSILWVQIYYLRKSSLKISMIQAFLVIQLLVMVLQENQKHRF